MFFSGRARLVADDLRHHAGQHTHPHTQGSGLAINQIPTKVLAMAKPLRESKT
jgi:hypothetical protein